MRQIDDKRNPKIGRPVKTQKGLEFKKQYLVNQTKFQLQCELLVSIHQKFFVEPPLDPSNRRVEISYITALFQKYDCMKVYEVLLKLNQFYYKNSSIFPEDKLKYTSLIDVSYMVKQLRLNLGEKLRCMQLTLTIIFFLYNQKLMNLNFYQYIETKLDIIAASMVTDPSALRINLDKIELLIITLILEIASKQEIKLKK